MIRRETPRDAIAATSAGPIFTPTGPNAPTTGKLAMNGQRNGAYALITGRSCKALWLSDSASFLSSAHGESTQRRLGKDQPYQPPSRRSSERILKFRPSGTFPSRGDGKLEAGVYEVTVRAWDRKDNGGASSARLRVAMPPSPPPRSRRRVMKANERVDASGNILARDYAEVKKRFFHILAAAAAATGLNAIAIPPATPSGALHLGDHPTRDLFGARAILS